MTSSSEKAQSRKKPLLIFFGCAALLFLAIVGEWQFETNFYRRALPAELETEGLATTGSDFSLLRLLMPIRLEACGGAIFRLTERNVADIKRQGLSFFRAARQGRGYQEGDPGYRSHIYQPWQEAPVPDSWVSEGTWLGLACMNLGRDLTRSITSAARGPGVYFTTTTGGAFLVVLPEMKLVVFTYTS